MVHFQCSSYFHCSGNLIGQDIKFQSTCKSVKKWSENAKVNWTEQEKKKKEKKVRITGLQEIKFQSTCNPLPCRPAHLCISFRRHSSRLLSLPLSGVIVCVPTAMAAAAAARKGLTSGARTAADAAARMVPRKLLPNSAKVSSYPSRHPSTFSFATSTYGPMGGAKRLRWEDIPLNRKKSCMPGQCKLLFFWSSFFFFVLPKPLIGCLYKQWVGSARGCA